MGGNLSSTTYVATGGIDKSLGNFSCYLLLSKPGQELPRMSRSAVWHAIMLSAYVGGGSPVPAKS